jgi:hypothetical protein
MKGFCVWLSLVFVAFFAVGAYSYTIQNINFPYKGIVYDGLHIPATNYNDIKITRDEYYFFEFTYRGKEFKCRLLVFGAIYVDVSEGLDKIFCFDVNSFRMRTMGGSGN